MSLSITYIPFRLTNTRRLSVFFSKSSNTTVAPVFRFSCAESGKIGLATVVASVLPLPAFLTITRLAMARGSDRPVCTQLVRWRGGADLHGTYSKKVLKFGRSLYLSGTMPRCVERQAGITCTGTLTAKLRAPTWQQPVSLKVKENGFDHSDLLPSGAAPLAPLMPQRQIAKTLMGAKKLPSHQ